MGDSPRLLLIAPVFFNYYKEIIKDANGLGFTVDYLCDAPSNSNISKAVGRVNKRFILPWTKRYFQSKIRPLIHAQKYDYVFVVCAMSFALTGEMICEIKSTQPQAKFVMYQWDSEDNINLRDLKIIHQCFDRVYSFDLYDCNSRQNYHYLPLFYIRNYELAAADRPHTFDYDCAYIGTAHPQKLVGINAISEDLKNVFPKQFIYHYMPSKLKFLYHKVLAPEFRHAKMSDFQTQKLSADQIVDIFRRSKCILDAPQAGQTGLTMRTIECLGAKRKLITTNADIRHYDFYHEDNVLIYDGKIDPNAPFFTNPYRELPVEIYEKYSLRNWLKTLLCE